MVQDIGELSRGGAAIHAATERSIRPAEDLGPKVQLETTSCYACTGWHTCLVFVTEGGLRVPLCEACLRLVVPRALEPNGAN